MGCLRYAFISSVVMFSACENSRAKDVSFDLSDERILSISYNLLGVKPEDAKFCADTFSGFFNSAEFSGLPESAKEEYMLSQKVWSLASKRKSVDSKRLFVSQNDNEKKYLCGQISSSFLVSSGLLPLNRFPNKLSEETMISMFAQRSNFYDSVRQKSLGSLLNCTAYYHSLDRQAVRGLGYMSENNVRKSADHLLWYDAVSRKLLDLKVSKVHNVENSEAWTRFITDGPEAFLASVDGKEMENTCQGQS